jgi:glyoxylase-like metal-dependent hydrolase (beta-lactamase superfamily II)
MTVTQHGNSLYKLTRLIAFNCFLVREDDGFTLIDTGMNGSADAILRAADALGAPIRRILLTHAHTDHVGSLDALAARLTDVEIMISERDARLLAGDMSIDPAEPQTPLKGGFISVTTTPTRLLTDGETIGALRVIATPGHTPGHISFMDQRDGTLIAGDAFSTQAGISTAGTLRLLFPFPAMATWHQATALASAERLLALNPSRLATGHGRVLEQPHSAMKAAIEEARQRIERKGQ